MVNVGNKAPAWTLKDSDGENVSLKDYTGKWLVFYFYPRDSTPGCTLEAIDFTKALPKFKKLGANVVGCSKDSAKSHCKFRDKHELKITLVCDEDHAVQEKYGVWRPKKFMGREFLGTIRSTFLIDPSGKIAYIWDPVSVKGHVDDVLTKLKELQ